MSKLFKHALRMFLINTLLLGGASYAQIRVDASPFFSPEEIQSGSYIQTKLKQRLRMNIVPPRNNSRFRTFVDIREFDNSLEYFLERPSHQITRNLQSLEQQGLRQARIIGTPWSDSYWPMYKGILGQRYADSEFARSGSGNFQRYFDYTQMPNNRFPDFIAGIHDVNNSKLLKLSPSEKYDLLVGDSNSSLTKRMWDEGMSYVDESGNMETWMGICHGWAAAAYIDDRPLNKVVVPAADGKTQLTFYPADIRGLITLLWANARTPSLAIGGRCNDKEPEVDDSGRITKPVCFDVHPGIWHISLAHKIGLDRKAFIMDATWDYEVWNQPILSYQFKYFNPETNRQTDSLEEAVLSLSQYPSDPYAAHRSTRARKIVGVTSTVEYLSENSPHHQDQASTRDDQVVTVQYRYDLELDDDLNIIGGEWHSRNHPDFLWTTQAGARAWSYADSRLSEDWSGQGSVPQSLRDAATGNRSGRGASYYGQPLGKIVRRLISLSQ